MFHQVLSQGTDLDCFTSWYLFPSTVDKLTMSYDYNSLILPSASHTRDLGHAKLQPGVPGGRPASTCLGIWSSKCCHTSTCSGIHQSRGPRRSTCFDLPRNPILRRPTCLNLPGDLIPSRLSCISLPGDLHPDPGTRGSQVATVLGRISFRKTYP